MSRDKRDVVLHKWHTAVPLILVLCGLALLASACQELGSDPDTDTAGTTTVTSVQSPGLDSLYGTWDGTYTPDAAWSEDGPIDDPPFDLGVPLDMHMELHPWSAAAGQYGTITVGGLSPARVTSLTLDGDQVTMIVVTEVAGLNDLLGAFTLTLDGDTLSGTDDREPEVPTGWISSSGAVYLTRTAPWDAAAAASTASADPSASSDSAADGTGGDAADGGADEDGDPLTVLSLFTPMSALTTTTEPPTRWTFDNDDDGRHVTVGVNDRILVRLDFAVADAVTQITFGSTSPSILQLRLGYSDQDAATMIYRWASGEGTAHAPGNVGITILCRHADGTLHDMWQLYVVVEE